MSEPLQPVPAPLPTARLDPPPDVQAAVASALHACHAWQPTAAPVPEPGKPPTLALTGTPAVEAGVCNTIDNWPKNADANAAFMLHAGVVFGLLAALGLVTARGAWRVFWQTRLGWWLQHRFGVPLQHILVVVPSLVGGISVGLLLAEVMSGTEPGSTAVWWTILFFGGSVGSALAVRQWRWWRHTGLM